ncbi:MAG TPA: glucosaminidase domain-containing protein [Prolixibacteraceae bacterium]|nr:glucosaminidase domain-containing protein [Prolixibacteraceae bacterium]
MKQTLILIVSLLLLSTVSARSQSKMSRRDYINTFKELAIKEMHRSGIPASITMAQACLESDNGNSSLAQRSNNHFGIKCKSDWKGEREFEDDDEKNECFRKYRTVFESYEDHTDYLMQTPRYAYLFKLSNKDYNAWANGLKAAGYATDPNYPARLIRIIEEERLDMLDNITPDGLSNQDIFAVKGKTHSSETRREKHKGNTFGDLTINPFGGREVKSKNELDIVYVNAGDTYESIAADLGMEPWELHVYNDLKKDAPQPEANTFLYIERKRCRALKGNDFHIVMPNETLHDISQEFGVRLNSLYFKNHLKKGSEPTVGSRIYLRKMKPKNTNDPRKTMKNE